MTGELFINGKDAWNVWGVNMGDGFPSAIDAFVPMKGYIENEERSQNGKSVILSLRRVASREITLKFTIKGDSPSDFFAKRKAFEQVLQSGYVNVNVPELGSQIYHLVYLGKNVSYAMNRARTFCTVSAKFEEPDPTNRK